MSRRSCSTRTRKNLGSDPVGERRCRSSPPSQSRLKWISSTSCSTRRGQSGCLEGGGARLAQSPPFLPQDPSFKQEISFASPQGRFSSWKGPQGQVSKWNWMRSSRTGDTPLKKVTPQLQASSVLFSPEELRQAELTWLGQPKISWAGCPKLGAMAAQSVPVAMAANTGVMAMAAKDVKVAMAAQHIPVAMASKTGVMAMAARNGIPGGWCLQQEDHPPYFQEHFNGVK